MSVKRVKVVTKKSPRGRLPRGKSPRGGNKLSLKFPTKANVPSGKLSETVILLYGEKKIGKTDLASQFSKDMLHLMHEPQARELAIHQVSCPDYEHTKEYIDMLLNEEHNYDSVSVDTITLFYAMAMDYTGKVHGFEHPTDENDYGKSWGKVSKNFSLPLLELLHSKLGVMFHAHETEEKIETREGRTYSIRRPDGMKGVKDFIDANIENVWYYHKRGRDRYLQIRGDDFAFACCSFKEKFLTPDGDQVFAVPMGKSAEEGYKNLVKAFNNKQTETYDELEEKEEEPTARRGARRKPRK